MQLPPLDALRAFHAVAEQGLLAAAAAKLPVRSSAICHQFGNPERIGVSSRDGIVVDLGSVAEDETILPERPRPGEREEEFPMRTPGACRGPKLASAVLLSREAVRRGGKRPNRPTAAQPDLDRRLHEHRPASALVVVRSAYDKQEHAIHYRVAPRKFDTFARLIEIFSTVDDELRQLECPIC